MINIKSKLLLERGDNERFWKILCQLEPKACGIYLGWIVILKFWRKSLTTPYARSTNAMKFNRKSYFCHVLKKCLRWICFELRVLKGLKITASWCQQVQGTSNIFRYMDDTSFQSILCSTWGIVKIECLKFYVYMIKICTIHPINYYRCSWEELS